MIPRRSVDVPPGPVDEGRQLLGEVLVVRLEGPTREELPEDLVGLCASTLSRVTEEHEVHLRFPVELEDHEDAHHELHGPLIGASLEDRPILGELHEDELQVDELVEREAPVVDGLEIPEGRQVFVLRNSRIKWSLLWSWLRYSRRLSSILVEIVPPVVPRCCSMTRGSSCTFRHPEEQAKVKRCTR